MGKRIPEKKSAIRTAKMTCFNLTNRYLYLKSTPIHFSQNLRSININLFWVRYISGFLNHYKSLEVNTSLDAYCDFTIIFLI